MKFNPRAKIDRSQVQDRRGQGGRRGGGMSGLPGLGRGGGTGGIPIPTGGGIGGIIVVIIIVVLGLVFGGNVLGGGSGSDQSATLNDCIDGSDAVQQDCRINIDVNAIQSFWTDYLPQAAGVDYQESDTVYLAGSTSTGCGQATSAMGPFYCPNDKTVYLDLTFFDDMLQGQLGASGGEFQEAYVLAHEYGHHIQDLLGTLGKHQSSATGPTSESVRIELQADCYAGVWTHYATTAKDENGEVFITEISDQDIKDAINAATAVGDDRIQQQTSGRVNPDQWTHGSAAERVQWFQTGYDSGQLTSCDTFAPGAL
ncbi:MAG TPA: neutral zinc metallopeptidase [Nocardioidaceae bacterium]|nr:neutral zinc metallopeptidase [Nocardioidaceae bacterium]